MDFEITKKVTAIITQGAKSVFTHMFVKEFAVSSSQNGVNWSPVLQDGKEKVGRAAPWTPLGQQEQPLTANMLTGVFARAVSQAVLCLP